MIQFFRRHTFIGFQLPAILWGAVIFIASSIPNATLPDLRFIPSDKAAHLLVYFIFCATLHRALAYQNRFPFLRRHALTLSFLGSVLYGMSDEFHQMFVPNRVAALDDLAVDALGALLFLLVLRLMRKHRPAHSSD